MSALDLEQFAQGALEKTLRELLRNRRFAALKIVDIQSSVDGGPDGEPALWVWVILDDPPVSLLTPERLRPVIVAITDGIAKHGMQLRLMLPVHVTFQRKSERYGR